MMATVFFLIAWAVLSYSAYEAWRAVDDEGSRGRSTSGVVALAWACTAGAVVSLALAFVTR